MVKALVTGVAGFIGSNLARSLLDRGDYVRGIDNFATGRRENLKGIEDHSSFELIEGDIRSESDVQTAVHGIECIYHQAAVPSVPRSVNDPRPTTRVNCGGTANIIAAARDHGVETIVAASSSSVYGSGGTLPRQESEPVNPESPYALSKYYTEQLTVQANKFYDIKTVALRYFNVFGPRQDPTGEYAAVIPKFINRMLDGKRPIVYGDGEQSRDFTYIDNVIKANISANVQSNGGEIFNVAIGARRTVNELINELNEILDTNHTAIYDDPRPGDVIHSEADVTKAQNMLDYDPSVGFREGLERTVEWMK